MLFQRSLDKTMSVVCVVSSKGWVVDQVSSHCNMDAVVVLLLGTMVDDNLCIHDCLI